MKTKTLSIAAIVLATLPLAASAALITSAAELPSPSVLVDFNDFTTRVNGVGPVQVGNAVSENIVFTSTSSGSFVGITTGYGLSANGQWAPNKGPFVGSNSDTAVQTFTFNSGLVSGVGAFLNYARDATFPNPLIEVLDGIGNVLESYDLASLAPISTPGATNDGAFRGIVRSSADIGAVRFSNDFVVIDDLRFSRTVPEPGTLALLGLGLAGLAASRRRRQ